MTTVDGLAPGTMVGRYQIVRALGAGGMGAVYESTHIDLDKRVALKVLHQAIAHSAEARARFLREGRITAKLRHPNVIDVTDVGVHEGLPYIVMEYLDGESLNTLLEREKTMSISQVITVMVPVMAAVEAAHSAGIIHRDLKPDNIFLAKAHDGALVPKVLDFGISKLADTANVAALTGASALLGSPSYLSPEQVRGARDVDARADQYSLGVILYECATGQMPFVHETLYGLIHEIVAGGLILPRVHRPDITPEFEKLILRAMSREPTARFSSVRELSVALSLSHSPAFDDVTVHKTRRADMVDSITIPKLVQPLTKTIEVTSLPTEAATEEADPDEYPTSVTTMAATDLWGRSQILPLQNHSRTTLGQAAVALEGAPDGSERRNVMLGILAAATLALVIGAVLISMNSPISAHRRAVQAHAPEPTVTITIPPTAVVAPPEVVSPLTPVAVPAMVPAPRLAPPRTPRVLAPRVLAPRVTPPRPPLLPWVAPPPPPRPSVERPPVRPRQQSSGTNAAPILE